MWTPTLPFDNNHHYLHKDKEQLSCTLGKESVIGGLDLLLVNIGVLDPRVGGLPGFSFMVVFKDIFKFRSVVQLFSFDPFVFIGVCFASQSFVPERSISFLLID